MKHKNLALSIGIVFSSIIILLVSCKKLNESTTLGSGLVPAVDNITTFDTLLEVQAFVDTFSLATDSILYHNSYTQYLGQINSDPFFGKTDAKMFLELKPSYYKHTFINRPDSLHLDSIVLVLDYVETYGDTMAQQTVNVYEVPQSSDFGDTAYTVRKSNYAKSTLLGSKSFIPASLKDSVKVYQDTTLKQLRIRLDDSFGNRLLGYDTSAATGRIPAYLSDSAFQKAFKGFALESVSGNGLIGINLNGANTKLAIYYKDDNGDKPVADWDTAVAYFPFSNEFCASANYVSRDYTGTALAAASGGTTPDDMVYIQNTPGSFATLKIPGLQSLNNRIVHRAELIMEQAYDVQDSIFSPGLLYLDAYDPAQSTFRTIPYDLPIDQNGAFNISALGSAPYRQKDQAGKDISVWRFNLSRYVQHVVNDTEPVYDLRVSAPLYVYNMYQSGPGAQSTRQYIPVTGNIGRGRVRLHGGTNISNPQRMRLRIVYSKI